MFKQQFELINFCLTPLFLFLYRSAVRYPHSWISSSFHGHHFPLVRGSLTISRITRHIGSDRYLLSHCVAKSIMGNIVNCCQTLRRYIQHKQEEQEVEEERSPLLSKEGSECDSPTPPDLDNDLKVLMTNSVLERDHFLFPDIVLSSNIGVGMATMGPTEYLLVMDGEEENRRREYDRRDDGTAKRPEGEVKRRQQLCATAQTQTDAETQVWMEVQTQTEVQTVETQTRTETDHYIVIQTEKQTGVQTQSQRDMLAVKLTDTELWTDIEIQTKTKILTEIQTQTEQNPGQMEQSTVAMEFSNIKMEHYSGQTEQITVCMEQNTVQTEQYIDQPEQNTIQMEYNTFLTEQINRETEHNIEHKVLYVNLTTNSSTQSKQTTDQVQCPAKTEQNSVPTEQKNNQTEQNEDEKELNLDKTKKLTKNDLDIKKIEESPGQIDLNAVQAERKVDPVEKEELGSEKEEIGDQRAELAVLQVEKDEARVEGGVAKADQRAELAVIQVEKDEARVEEGVAKVDPGVEQRELAFVQLEDGMKQKNVTLFVVDKLFLAPPHLPVGHPSLSQKVEDKAEEEGPGADQVETLSLQEVINRQEAGFTVRIQAPGSETFKLQVSVQMLVAELQQVLMDHEVTCHRTCFSLQLDGKALDSLTELQSVQDLQEGALIRVVEEPYTVRDARLHLRHVRNLLKSLDPTDAHNGVNGSSLSYLSLYIQGDMGNIQSFSWRSGERESVNLTPPDYILPGSKDRPLIPLQPMREDWKPWQCLRILTVSSWNPPPGNRKMHGDLMYLNAVTLEDRDLSITASTRGFYLNQSTAFNFNPKPATPKILCHSLVDLLCQVSPAFKKNFSTLQKKRVLRHPYERIATPFQVYCWTAPLRDHALDCIRAEETHTSRMEHFTNIDMLRGRELPRRNLPERLHRERMLFKTNSDFVAAATLGAIACVDGNIMPINPGEDPRSQMFIWSNLFFSLGFDVRDHYRPLGGDHAAHTAATCDLRGVQAYARLDTEGVTAQTIVPGILEKEQEQSVVYGSIDYGKTVLTHTRFLELLERTCEPLRIQRHLVLDHTHLPIELCSSTQTKGIVGNDGRHYIMDLLRSFPPDLNFLFTEDREELSEEGGQLLGYPRQHRHGLATLRPELLEAFVQYRYELFLKMVSSGLKKQERDPETQEDIGDEELSLTIAPGTQKAKDDLLRRDVLSEACKTAGSINDSCFDIRFNPDICSPEVRFPTECSEEVEKQRQLLKDAAVFLLANQIPALRDCLDHTALPMDGISLTWVLHQRGVNVRYLGTLLEVLENTVERERLSHLQRVAVSEVITRCAKHIFRTYLQAVEPSALSAAVSHFLNCFLGPSSPLSDSASFLPPDELLTRKRSRRRRSHGNRVSMVSESTWAKLTPSDLWCLVRTEARQYFQYTLHWCVIDEAVEQFGLQKISLLREMAVKTGIQVQLREYVFESRHKPVFGEEDVVNMFPVVKHLCLTTSDATQLIQHSQAAIQQGLLKEGYELISQALTLFSSVCGVLHQDVCVCLRLLGRLCYIMGDYREALSHQEKAVLLSERVLGIEHHQTIEEYTHLSLYCFAGGQPTTSLHLLYRARYLTLLVNGEDHPQVALLDCMLGLVLYGLLDYDLSLKFLLNALTLSSKYHGPASLKCAHSNHLLALVYERKGEFRSALQHEKQAYSIYRDQVGQNHESARESSEYLKSLTQQAVTLQRALNRIYGVGGSSASLTPLTAHLCQVPQLNSANFTIRVAGLLKDWPMKRRWAKEHRHWTEEELCLEGQHPGVTFSLLMLRRMFCGCYLMKLPVEDL
uniref:Clu domain-containing protein n=1 Tax=Esox lucius TaxID=8010 RepID=A0A6Q2YP14_ESOLU